MEILPLTRTCRARFWAVLFAFVLAPASAVQDPPKRTYILAVVPHQLPMFVYKEWTPLVKLLSRRIGADIELRTYRTIPRFEAELFRGIPDFAFMNPYHEIMAKKAQGYVPLVRGDEPLSGILVVRRDSPIKSVGDLQGKTIAFAAPNAFGSSLYMRALLTEQFGIKFKPYYVDAHNEVYRHVILEEAVGGGGIKHTLDIESDAVKSQLRILFETPKTASHCLSAHPRVPPEIRELVLNTILSLGTDKSEQQWLERIQLAAPVKANYDKDYKPLEKLGLEKYLVVGE
jgi:phosphonate transport system substrate-binding protein